MLKILINYLIINYLKDEQYLNIIGEEIIVFIQLVFFPTNYSRDTSINRL